MRKMRRSWCAMLVLLSARCAGHPAVVQQPPGAAAGQTPYVKLVTHADEQRVDVLFDDRPFTSYRWASELKKPLLYPLRTAEDAVVTRGWPLDPRPGEPTDHPHHIGFWLNYGDVNGVDFWGN